MVLEGRVLYEAPNGEPDSLLAVSYKRSDV